MTQFLELNFAEYNLNQDFLKIVSSGTIVCVCCLDQTGPFVDIRTCNHSDFFDNICNFTLDIPDMAVCAVCHRMLAKIMLFTAQVKDSLRKLTEQSKDLTPKRKVNDLQFSNQQNTWTFDLDADNPEFKIEPPLPSIETEVKIESDNADISDEDTSLPLSEVKKEMSRRRAKKNQDRIGKIQKNLDASGKLQKNRKAHSQTTRFGKLYSGKIRLIALTVEQLQAEREGDRLKETYKKLPFKCEDCVRGFDHEATLQDHVDKHHTYRDGSLQCDICKCYLSSNNSLNEHCRRHLKRYECVTCNKRNNTLPAVIAHYNECHGDSDDVIPTTYTCHECGVTVTTNRAYRYHLEKHRGKEQCSACGKAFVNKHGLKTHMLTVHKLSSRVYACAPCNKTYKAKSGWLLHLAAHHQPTAAYCPPCRTHFSTQTMLRHHLRTHSRHVGDADKKFACAECGKKFLTRPALKEHVDWVHLKNTQHACPHCDKIFKNKSALRKHNDFVHNKKRPPRNKICDHCGRGFTTLQILRSHVRTHTGERPLRCRHCDASFAHPAALYTHNKLLHGAANTQRK